MKIPIPIMAIFRKIREFSQVIIFVILPQNDSLGLKIKVVKFLEIQPRYVQRLLAKIRLNSNRDTVTVFIQNRRDIER